MPLKFTRHPGMFERYLQRKHNTPLFGDSEETTAETLKLAQDRDKDAHDQFIQSFQQLVQEIVNLDNETESQTVLDLKSQLDKSFESAATLPGDLTDIRDAIQKLMSPMMQAIQAGAGDDPAAQATLADEDKARSHHFAMLEVPLIADILSPDSPIKPEELPATLLSEETENLPLVLTLFTADQHAELASSCQRLSNNLESKGISISFYQSQLELIKAVSEAELSHIYN